MRKRKITQHCLWLYFVIAILPVNLYAQNEYWLNKDLPGISPDKQKVLHRHADTRDFWVLDKRANQRLWVNEFNEDEYKGQKCHMGFVFAGWSPNSEYLLFFARYIPRGYTGLSGSTIAVVHWTGVFYDYLAGSQSTYRDTKPRDGNGAIYFISARWIDNKNIAYVIENFGGKNNFHKSLPIAVSPLFRQKPAEIINDRAHQQTKDRSKTQTVPIKNSIAQPSLRQLFYEAISPANILPTQAKRQIKNWMNGEKTGLMRLPIGRGKDLVVCDLLDEYPGNDILFYYPYSDDPDTISFPTRYVFRILGFVRDQYYPVWEFDTEKKYYPNNDYFNEFLTEIEAEANCRGKLENNALGKTPAEIARLYITINQHNQNLGIMQRMRLQEVENIKCAIERNGYAIVVATTPHHTNGYVLRKSAKGYQVIGNRETTKAIAREMGLSKETLFNLGEIEIEGEHYSRDYG